MREGSQEVAALRRVPEGLPASALLLSHPNEPGA